MQIKTANENDIKPYLDKLVFPQNKSHKGNNGKLLIIGGSKLFHAASLWAADIACRVVDMVHYASTAENEKIFIHLKTLFVNGIIVKKKDIPHYVEEDDCILVGPGMIRGKIKPVQLDKNTPFSNILEIKNEAVYTYSLSHYLMAHYPNKQYVFDAGALQMMDKEWLLQLKTKPVLTPHKLEFEKLFGISLDNKTSNEIAEIAKKMANKYHCILLLKAVDDIVTDGVKVVTITGGNAGLTKGGTGDTLAGLCAGLCTKNDPFLSAIVASILVKKTADHIFEKKHFWYNTSDLIKHIPTTLKELL